jgi:hypothetical protein
MEKNDDEQEQLVPGLAQSGSGEVFAFHIQKVIIHVEGEFFQHSFWVEASISKQYLNYLDGGIRPQKHLLS